MQDSNTQTVQALKHVSVRWPKAFWLALTMLVAEKDTSLQDYITLAVQEKIKHDKWFKKDLEMLKMLIPNPELQEIVLEENE
jgi:bifunctional pyridoxal-dependent enzyme with beta-cystathionase and maltose regulon repressor activities